MPTLDAIALAGVTSGDMEVAPRLVINALLSRQMFGQELNAALFGLLTGAVRCDYGLLTQSYKEKDISHQLTERGHGRKYGTASALVQGRAHRSRDAWGHAVPGETRGL